MCSSLHNLPPCPLIMPLSTTQCNVKSKYSSEFLFPEDIENLTAFLEEQEHFEPSGTKLKKSSTKSKKKDKAPSPPSQPDQSASVENLILLETLHEETLGTELKIAEVKLELMKLSALFAGCPTPSFPCEVENSDCALFNANHSCATIHHAGLASHQKENKHFYSQQVWSIMTSLILQSLLMAFITSE